MTLIVNTERSVKLVPYCPIEIKESEYFQLGLRFLENVDDVAVPSAPLLPDVQIDLLAISNYMPLLAAGVIDHLDRLTSNGSDRPPMVKKLFLRRVGDTSFLILDNLRLSTARRKQIDADLTIWEITYKVGATGNVRTECIFNSLTSTFELRNCVDVFGLHYRTDFALVAGYVLDAYRTTSQSWKQRRDAVNRAITPEPEFDDVIRQAIQELRVLVDVNHPLFKTLHTETDYLNREGRLGHLIQLQRDFFNSEYIDSRADWWPRFTNAFSVLQQAYLSKFPINASSNAICSTAFG